MAEPAHTLLILDSTNKEYRAHCSCGWTSRACESMTERMSVFKGHAALHVKAAKTKARDWRRQRAEGRQIRQAGKGTDAVS